MSTEISISGVFLTCSGPDWGWASVSRVSSRFTLKEPGTDAQIKQFAQSHDAQYDVFSKIDVNGDGAHPLWKWLKEQPNGRGFLGK